MKGDDSANTDTFLLQGLPFVQFTLKKGLRSHEIISLLGCLVNGRIRVLIYAAINVNLLGGNAGNGWGFDGEIQNLLLGQIPTPYTHSPLPLGLHL